MPSKAMLVDPDKVDIATPSAGKMIGVATLKTEKRKPVENILLRSGFFVQRLLFCFSYSDSVLNVC